MDEASKRSFLKETDLKVAAAWKSIDAFGFGFLALTVSTGLAFAGQISAKDQPGEYDKQMKAGYELLKEGEVKRREGESARQAGHFYEAPLHYGQAIELDEKALELFKSAENYALQEDHKKHAVFFEGVALIEKG